MSLHCGELCYSLTIVGTVLLIYDTLFGNPALWCQINKHNASDYQGIMSCKTHAYECWPNQITKMVGFTKEYCILCRIVDIYASWPNPQDGMIYKGIMSCRNMDKYAD